MFYSMKNDFEKEFGKLTTAQLWVIIRFAKQVRMRCRSNKAFNNFAELCFPYANFQQVTKTHPITHVSYEGLKITIDGQSTEDSPDEN